MARRRLKDRLMSGGVTVLFGAIALALALCPTWFWFGVRYALAPQGFWQNFFLFGVGLWVLGSLQLVLLIGWLIFVGKLILDPP